MRCTHVRFKVRRKRELDSVIGKSNHKFERTSDGGNGNHIISLPIILIKIKVDQMLPSSFISWFLFYDFAFDFLFP